MVAALLGVVLLLFELVLIARMVVDWVGVLSPSSGGSGLYQARRIIHGITEPVIGPVRRVLNQHGSGPSRSTLPSPQCSWG